MSQTLPASPQAADPHSWPSSTSSSDPQPWAARSQLHPLPLLPKQRLASINSAKYLGEQRSGRSGLWDMHSDEEDLEEDLYRESRRRSEKEDSDDLMAHLDSIMPGVLEPVAPLSLPPVSKKNTRLPDTLLTPYK